MENYEGSEESEGSEEYQSEEEFLSEEDQPASINPELIQSSVQPLDLGALPPIIIKSESVAPPIPAELIQPASTQTTFVQPAPTKTVTTQIQPVKLVVEKPVTLDSLLIKRNSESQMFFDMRSIYAKIALSVFQGKINPATAILLGEMATNKAIYGLVYPEDSDRVIRYINEQIVNNY